MKTQSNQQKPKAYSYLRFSTPEQLKGDSLRRQTELTQRYVKKHDLELDETLTFQDLGISAFHGLNLAEGALGAFLEAVNDGVIKKGSYLIVENLDRLSRQNVFQAFQQFTNIITKGINIITLQDDKVYTAEQGALGFSDLMISITIMQRAHEESLIKSKRLSASWEHKRREAQNGAARKLTGRCPAWLELSADKTFFHVIEERAEIVKRIFELTLAGFGKVAIRNLFNKERVLTFGRSEGWHASYLSKILDNDAVVGIYQPHKMEIVNGKKKRIPDGDPISDYFPAIMDLQTFLKAKQIRVDRRIPGGNFAKQFSNLFTGVTVCGNCGASMVFENKGKHPIKGGSYLVCSNGRRNVGSCRRHSWRYEQALCHIMMNLLEVDYRKLFPEIYKKIQLEVNILEDRLLVKNDELIKINNKIDNLVKVLMDMPDSKAVKDNLTSLETNKVITEDEILKIKSNIHKHLKGNGGTEQDNRSGDFEAAMDEFVRIEREGSHDEIIDARRRLHQQLQQIIDKISFSSSNDRELHGEITISFKGLGVSRQRVLCVSKNQRDSKGYLLDNDDDHQGFHIAVTDAQWPPVDRIVSGEALYDLLFH